MHSKILWAAALAVLFIATGNAQACGPGGFGSKFAGGGGRFGGAKFAGNGFAGMQQQNAIAGQKQFLAMQARAYNARMKSSRIARARQLRDRNLALRTANRQRVIAMTEEYRRRRDPNRAPNPGVLLANTTPTLGR